jgi:mRNA-degrading endonuclease RelE of RelBE toxin-antitoxin system
MHVVKNKLEEAAQDPTRYKQLHYELRGSCRLRIGKLRVIFSYDILKKELYLEKVILDHRYRDR